MTIDDWWFHLFKILSNEEFGVWFFQQSRAEPQESMPLSFVTLGEVVESRGPSDFSSLAAPVHDSLHI